MSMTVKDSLFLISGLQTLVISIILLLYRSKKIQVNFYLGLFFLTLFVEIIMYFVIKQIHHPSVYYVPFRFDFLSVNFLFFYAIKTSGIVVRNTFNYYIPALIEFFVLALFFLIVLENPEFHETLVDYNIGLVMRVLSSVYIVIMCMLIVRVNEKHKKMLPFFYRNIKYKSLNWLTIFCGICILLNVVRQLRFTLESVYFIHIAFDVLVLFSLYYITIASLVQINILNITFPKKEEEIELKEVFTSINNHISMNKSYLNPSMNLKMFASEIQLPERMISKAINKIENKNFNNYVNYYRIEEFKDKIASDYHKKYSISAIANEVGFNSRASFYKNFKEIVGVSPSEYVESVSD